MPLLNRSQLVTSWREILPPMRDPEVRRIPLELTAPGMYVVEAVAPPHRAYTVVIISDVGLVSKAAPGQVLLYAADRRTGAPVAGCEVRVIATSSRWSAGRRAPMACSGRRWSRLPPTTSCPWPGAASR